MTLLKLIELKGNVQATMPKQKLINTWWQRSRWASSELHANGGCQWITDVKIKCTVPRNCDYGIVKDIQDCCDVCTLGPKKHFAVDLVYAVLDWFVSNIWRVYMVLWACSYKVSWSRLCNLNHATIDIPKDRSWELFCSSQLDYPL